ncbi:hypothetical protein [Tellurirhabdus bombi]|uniref:hypothetical protein n=1 Tax=Tellurirhabdus bombi TaxID=2907205 RepID=UPI001F1B8C34|nr:hypothetical protein [Tellurirhabdus bombi]
MKEQPLQLTLQNLHQILPSYINLYHSLLFKIQDSGLTTLEIAEQSNIRLHAVALRKRKPELWSVGEIRLLAKGFGMSETVCIRLEKELDQLTIILEALPVRQRKQFFMDCGLPTRRSSSWPGHRWVINDLKRFYQYIGSTKGFMPVLKSRTRVAIPVSYP